MPTFDTPQPISARIDVSSGSVTVRASGRSDTVVAVRPRNPRSSADVAAADNTLVHFSAGELRGPFHRPAAAALLRLGPGGRGGGRPAGGLRGRRPDHGR